MSHPEYAFLNKMKIIFINYKYDNKAKQKIQLWYQTIDNQINMLKDMKKDMKKDIRNLERVAQRALIREQRSERRRGNVQNGFLRPLRVSQEMLNFTGWEPSKLYSRVDVTRFICNYIKSRGLQNVYDRRQIVPDESLTRLLQYDQSNGPLTFCSIQRYLQRHFIK